MHYCYCTTNSLDHASDYDGGKLSDISLNADTGDWWMIPTAIVDTVSASVVMRSALSARSFFGAVGTHVYKYDNATAASRSMNVSFDNSYAQEVNVIAPEETWSTMSDTLTDSIVVLVHSLCVATVCLLRGVLDEIAKFVMVVVDDGTLRVGEDFSVDAATYDGVNYINHQELLDAELESVLREYARRGHTGGRGAYARKRAQSPSGAARASA